MAERRRQGKRVVAVLAAICFVVFMLATAALAVAHDPLHCHEAHCEVCLFLHRDAGTGKALLPAALPAALAAWAGVLCLPRFVRNGRLSSLVAQNIKLTL